MPKLPEQYDEHAREAVSKHPDIDTVIDSLQAVPQEKFVKEFFFKKREWMGPENTLQVEIEADTTIVPVLEAIGARMKFLKERALDQNGEIKDPNAILDLDGLFRFLNAYMQAELDSGHNIKRESIETFDRALKELRPLVDAAIEAHEDKP